jgi:DeoR family transcriptional regulator of aga operon
MPTGLPSAARRRQILALVRGSGLVRIHDLAERFGVSKVTIRTDLGVLAERGHVVRVHGGAIPSSPSAERAFEARQAVGAEEKIAIAEAAVGLISSGQSLILDVGTTTMAIAHAIVGETRLESLVVFTNALNVALALEPAIPRVEVMVTGGLLRPLQHSLVEPRASAFFDEIRADWAFIGCDGIHPARGITTTNIPEATMKQAMLRASHRRVVVADSSKFMREALTRVCSLDDVDTILTAGEIENEVLSAFADAPTEIRVAAAPHSGEEERVYRFNKVATEAD